jgi:hypothetical protein
MAGYGLAHDLGGEICAIGWNTHISLSPNWLELGDPGTNWLAPWIR